jgi:ABC-2 type transport system ATP-binding protein
VSALLRVEDLDKRYGELQALTGVHLQAAAGEIVAIVGPNGAGKTTLLSIIAGLQRPSAGSVNLGPRQVGWAPQQQAVYSRLSVTENLELFARLEGVADPADAVEGMLEQTGLRSRADELVGRLSGGNRQRVNVALALIAGPPVLALDEPSAALDPGQRERLWEFIAGLARGGTTVLFSTHNIGEVERWATRVVVLAGGTVLLDGTPASLRAAAGPGLSMEEALVAFLREHGPGDAEDGP